ncbi:MAG: calcium-binding protein [Pseudomonadota bacterium]
MSVVNGGSGNDTLTGTSGDDQINGFEGDDGITVTAGHDVVDGGIGSDTLIASGNGTFILGASSFTNTDAGVDTVFSNIEMFHFTKENGNASIDASAFTGTNATFRLLGGDSTVVGNDGFSFFEIHGGTNQIDGRGNYDHGFFWGSDAGGYMIAPPTIYFTDVGNTVVVTQSGYMSATMANVESFSVLSGNFIAGFNFDGSASSAIVTINMTSYADTLIGTSGTNYFFSNNAVYQAGDVLTGFGGADGYYFDQLAQIRGTRITDLGEDDRIDLTGTVDHDSVTAQFIGSGAFTNVAGQYRSRIVDGETLLEADTNGDGFPDSVLTMNGTFFLAETAPGSKILAISGRQITGDEGANRLSGGSGNDAIIGKGGDDRIDGGTGADAMTGGTGNDSFVVDNAGDTVFEAAGEGTIDRVATTVSWTLGAGQEIEQITVANMAGTAAINLTGNELANKIAGNEGVNVLNGGGGNDKLSGFGGDDVLNGGTGADQMNGGAGNDGYVVDDAGDTVIEANTGGADSDTVTALVSYTLAVGQEVERLRTGPGSDPLNLTGNEFGQKIQGNEGANILNGGGGNDNLIGGGGADRLVGGTGADKLTGGDAADTFVFEVGGGLDMIMDFATGTDKIDLAVFGLSWAQVQGAMTENAGTTTINLGGGDLVRISGVASASLGESDFLLAGGSGSAWFDAFDSQLWEGGTVDIDGPLPALLGAEMWHGGFDWHTL